MHVAMSEHNALKALCFSCGRYMVGLRGLLGIAMIIPVMMTVLSQQDLACRIGLMMI